MNYKEEVLSLLEQELSYRGDYFIFSELSGWSANVRKERILDDKYFYEMSVIKLIEDFGPFRNRFKYLCVEHMSQVGSRLELLEHLRLVHVYIGVLIKTATKSKLHHNRTLLEGATQSATSARIRRRQTLLHTTKLDEYTLRMNHTPTTTTTTTTTTHTMPHLYPHLTLKWRIDLKIGSMTTSTYDEWT